MEKQLIKIEPKNLDADRDKDLKINLFIGFKIVFNMRATRIGCNNNIETNLNIELRITILFSFILLLQTSCR